MSYILQAGDSVLYTSRKNGRKYVGFYGRTWTDKFGRKCATIYSLGAHDMTRELANPFIEDVQLLTDELHMLWKLENA